MIKNFLCNLQRAANLRSAAKLFFRPNERFTTVVGVVRRLSGVDAARIDVAKLKEYVCSAVEKRAHTESVQHRQTELMEMVLNSVVFGEVSDTEIIQVVNDMNSQHVNEVAGDIFNSVGIAGPDAVYLAVPLFRLAALRGNVNAKYTYAQFLRTGQGIPSDPCEAASLFTELAKQGHPYAQLALGSMFSSGFGVEEDLEKAVQLYELSAENGVAQAHHALGQLYLDGRVKSVISDDNQAEAVKCFKRGAELEDAQSHFSLAHCYTHGKGVEKDEKNALSHLQIAAKANLPVAIHNLACAYFAGKGVDLDFSVAAEWFEKAAKLGFAPAQVNLGNMHYHGLGVEKDMEKAKELYLQASVTDRNALALYEKVVNEEVESKT